MHNKCGFFFLKFISCILHKNNININTFEIQQIINNKQTKNKQTIKNIIMQSIIDGVYFKSLVCFRAINEHHKPFMIKRPYTKIHVYIMQ